MSTPAPAPRLQDRIKELRRVPGSELRANPLNYRRHPQAQRSALAGILQKVGIAAALIARDTPEGLLLIDGHLRAEDYGDQDWPVLILDVTEEEGNLLLASMDPLGALAEHDAGTLDALLALTEPSNDALGAMFDQMRANASKLLPEFTPDDPSNQGDLDAIKTIACPACGHEFAT